MTSTTPTSDLTHNRSENFIEWAQNLTGTPTPPLSSNDALYDPTFQSSELNFLKFVVRVEDIVVSGLQQGVMVLVTGAGFLILLLIFYSSLYLFCKNVLRQKPVLKRVRL